MRLHEHAEGSTIKQSKNANTRRGKHTPLRLTHSALMLAYAAWSSATSFELSTCSTLRMLLLRGRLWGCSETPGSFMLGGLEPLMVGMGGEEKDEMTEGPKRVRAQRVKLWQ
jgi:hypothetical protein